MRKRNSFVLAAIFSLTALAFTSGCGKIDPGATKATVKDESLSADAVETGPAAQWEAGRGDVTGTAREEKQRLLNTMTRAIEAQFPDETFAEVPESETEKHIPLIVRENYVLAGRRSLSGREYIAGVSLREENPLEGMSCRMSDTPVEYVTSQFANGRFVLMERAGQDDGRISQLYDLLQRGEDGLMYMLDATERGTTLVMPEGTPFLLVRMVKNTIPVTEYIRLSKEEYKTLKEGTETYQEEGEAGALLLCEGGEDLQALWEGEVPFVSEEMIKLAREKCGYIQDEMPEEGRITQGSLTINIHGETREETTGNRDDLRKLMAILNRITPQSDIWPAKTGAYEGILTLREQDGSEHSMHIGLSSGNTVLGTSRFGELQEEDREQLWRLFSTIDGWIRYGDKITLRVKDVPVAEDDPNITFILENKTGGPIKYILTPLYTKMEGDSYKRLESVAGFCGVTDILDGETAELSVPWGGAFLTEGEGNYRLEIQVQPEEGIRFGVSDIFVVKK